MRELYVIAHNMRSTFNVGSLLRTAEGFGVTKVYLTGYTPYPTADQDDRLPHIRDKIAQQIHKTALGAEDTQAWQHIGIGELFAELAVQSVPIVALELTEKAVPLHRYKAPDKLALLLGEEVNGIPPEILSVVRDHVCIPMKGQKESFNVVIALAAALYELTFH
jgi:tRNA G18 (ribose-2'-O)-methylase SpoU